MKRFCCLTVVIMIVAIVFSGCIQSEDPLEIQGDNNVSLMTLTGDANDCSGEMVTTLSAGQTVDVGAVTCRLEGNILYIDYATGEDWVLVATHLDVEESLEDFPLWWWGMPKLYLFPYKQWHFPFVTEYTYALDLETCGLDDAVEVYVSAHAFAVKFSESGWIEQIASAWGEGERFVKPCTDGDPRIRDLASGPGTIGEGEKLAQIISEDQRVAMEMDGLGWEDLIHIGPPMYFIVNINQLKGLVLWNKLGSQEEVENSEVGPDGVIVGDIDYLPCKHGLGFKPLPRTGDHNIPDNFIDFSGLNLGNQGCIEFWYLPDWIDGSVGHVIDIFQYGVEHDRSNNNHIGTAFNDWQNMMGMSVRNSGQTMSVGINIRPSSIPGWSTTEPFHMAFTWDGTDPVINERLKFFVNGQRIGSSSHSGDPTLDDWLPDAVLRLATRLISGDWNRHHWEGNNAVIDNIKVWNCPKTDFSDRFEE